VNLLGNHPTVSTCHTTGPFSKEKQNKVRISKKQQ